MHLAFDLGSVRITVCFEFVLMLLLAMRALFLRRVVTSTRLSYLFVLSGRGSHEGVICWLVVVMMMMRDVVGMNMVCGVLVVMFRLSAVTCSVGRHLVLDFAACRVARPDAGLGRGFRKSRDHEVTRDAVRGYT